MSQQKKSSMLFRMESCTSLADMLIGRLPEEIFVSSTTTFVDPAMGSGQYLVAVAKRLLQYGHSKENILSRLYGCEVNELYVQVFSETTPLSGANIKIMSYEDAIAWRNTMHFTAEVGNPPYNGSSNNDSIGKQTEGADIYKDFYLSAVANSDHVAMLMSARWTKGFQETVLATAHTIGYATKYFKQQTKGIEIVYVVSDTAKVSTTVDVVDKSDNVSTIKNGDYSLTDIISPMTATDKSLVGKCSVGPNMDLIWKSYNSRPYGPGTTTLLKEGKYPIVSTPGAQNDPNPIIAYTDYPIEQPEDDKWKVIFGKSGTQFKLNALKVIGPNLPVSGQIQFLYFDTEQEAHNAIAFMRTPLMVYYVAKVKSSIENSQAFWRKVPLLDFTIRWTNSELYAQFELTPEEIAMIEEVKK